MVDEKLTVCFARIASSSKQIFIDCGPPICTKAQSMKVLEESFKEKIYINTVREREREEKK